MGFNSGFKGLNLSTRYIIYSHINIAYFVEYVIWKATYYWTTETYKDHET